MRDILRRHASDRLTRLLSAFPVVALTGARQVGKSTLARALLEGIPGTYVSLDGVQARTTAAQDPEGFVRDREGLVVIDEVQLEPSLMSAIKVEVDRDRRPGRFLITGSANLLRLRSVGESLAGRSAWYELPPLTWSEIRSEPCPTVLDDAFASKDAEAFVRTLGMPVADQVLQARERAVRGGMPGTLGLDDDFRRDWYDGYRQTFLERDLRRISHIENQPDFNRVMSLALLRTANLLNRNAIASDAGVSQPTVKRYLNVLEVAYQLRELPSYHSGLTKRLVRSPKLLACDVGLASHVASVSDWDGAARTGKDGAFFETWVVNELLAIDALSDKRSTAMFWRTSGGAEVDLVLERGERVLAVEMKSAATVRYADSSGLRALRDDLGDRFGLGIVAYLGREASVIHDRICLVPVGSLLGLTR
jgi:predicted AAA+ superfamily ATPase